MRFNGSLDDFRVYNRKLSPWEVYQIYGEMAWYKLDETSGTVCHRLDRSRAGRSVQRQPHAERDRQRRLHAGNRRRV